MTQGKASVGHPIDVSTGAMFIDATDVSLAGLVALTFSRHYNTAWLSRPSGTLGRGWRCGLDYELRETLEGFRYTTGQGVEFEFQLAPGQNMARRPGDGLELTRHGEHEIRIFAYGRRRLEAEMVFRRPQPGRRWVLHAVQRNAKARVEFVRDSDGRIVLARQTRERRALRLNYDAQGRICAVLLTDFDGRTQIPQVQYRYSASGDLIAVEDRRGVAVTFEYDAAGLMRSENRRGGMVYTFAYDAQQRCIHATGQDHYHERRLQYLARTTYVTDSHGFVQRYDFNDAGQIEFYESATGLRLVYTYDDLGRLLTQATPNGGTYSYGYDGLGRCIRDGLPTGEEIHYEWADDHRLAAIVDWAGRRTEFQRDSDGRIVNAHMSAGASWKYRYNDWGDLICIEFPDGTRKQLSYDGFGNISAMADRRGHAWSFAYDGLGQMTSSTDPLGRTARYEYDRGGALTRYVGRDGRVVQWTHAEDGRRVREIRSDGTWREVLYNCCGLALEITDFDRRTTKFEWDSEPGRLRRLVAPDGLATETEYNEDGFPVLRRAWDGREYRIEWAGDLAVVGIDPTGRRVELEYDAGGRPVRQTTNDGVTEFEWDDFYAIGKIVTPSGELSFERDAFGQVVREVQDGFAIERGYDINGRRTRLEVDGSVTEFGFMPTGHLQTASWDGQRLDFELDALGRETRRRYGFGGELESTYDDEGRLAGTALRIAGVATPTVQRVYGYNGNGLLGTVQDSLRGVTRYTHSPAGALIGEFSETGAARLFGYDRSGGRRWMADVPDGDAFVRQLGAGSVAEWNGARGDEVAASLGGVGTGFRYGEPRRLTQVQRPGETVDYTYDDCGFLIAKTVRRDDRDLVETCRYHWNSSGQLVGFEAADGRRYEYRYDGYGRRMLKIGPEGETRYLWDNTDLVRIIGPETQQDLVYEPRTGQLLALREGGKTRHVLCDHRGAPAELFDEQGQLIAALRPGAFGEDGRQNLRAGVPTVAPGEHQFGLLGQIFDQESGLYYNLFRYYDAELGRFISPDPVGLDGGLEPYALGNALLAVDPLGLASQRYPGPYWNSSYFNGSPPTSSTMGDSRITPAGDTDTRHWGGADVSHNGSGDTVPMHNNTMTRVYDGDPNSGGQLVYGTFNGHEHVGDPDTGRLGHGALNPVTNADSPISRGSWWHAEQWALGLGVTNPHANAALRNGTGPVVVDISRPPCCRCADTIKAGAQHLADSIGRPVEIRWPGQTSEEADGHKVSPSTGCG